jgi:hypothetical protein
MTKTVRFVVQNGPYMPGELAGFPDAHADRLVAAGVAEESDAGAPVANAPGHRGVATRTEPPRTLRRGTIVTKVDTPVGTPAERTGPTATAPLTSEADTSGNDGNVTTGEGEAGHQGGGVIGGSSSRAQAPEAAPVEGQQPEEQPQGEGKSTRAGKAGGKA